MKKPLTRSLWILLVLSAVDPASAYLSCTEPSEPYCLSLGGKFDSESEFRSCRSELEDYLGYVKRYRECLYEEADDTAKKANEMIEKFNCLAKGKSACL